jgi:hypothetical protein
VGEPGINGTGDFVSSAPSIASFILIRLLLVLVDAAVVVLDVGLTPKKDPGIFCWNRDGGGSEGKDIKVVVEGAPCLSCDVGRKAAMEKGTIAKAARVLVAQR